MSVVAGDRSGPGALRGRDDRVCAAALPDVPGEAEIGAELVALFDKELRLTVCADLSVRVRVYAADRRTVLVDVGTTADRALRIAALFQRAAQRAGAVLEPIAVPTGEGAS